ncbi:MAG: hypothetical protein IID44_07860 [Planctomycetes bacterium]|nr:hypothetical protein [Planctomycetota bacterium]
MGLGSVLQTALSGISAAELALEGDGFFIVEGGGEQPFTRNGNFSLNAASELVTSDGHRVLGFAVDGNFNLQTTELSTLRISRGRQAASEDGSTATLTNFRIGSDGVINGQFSDGQTRLACRIGPRRRDDVRVVGTGPQVRRGAVGVTTSQSPRQAGGLRHLRRRNLRRLARHRLIAFARPWECSPWECSPWE